LAHYLTSAAWNWRQRKGMFDLGNQLAETAVIGPLSLRDTGVSRDDECNPVSYGPFRPEKAKEKANPRTRV
jgi:hypothetical protein